MWSPIMDISTWLPHCEHLMVGKKLDSRAIAIVNVVSPDPVLVYGY